MATLFVKLMCVCMLTMIAQSQPPLDTIVLPPGFIIEVLANKSAFHVNEPRELNVQFYEGSTIIYMSSLNQNAKTVVALIDRDSDNSIDSSFIIFKSNESLPITSLAVHPKTGQLILTAPDQTYKCTGNANDIILNSFNSSDDRLQCEPWFQAPYADMWHSYHYMRFNPNTNDLCVAYGQPCNECINKTQTPPKSCIICYDSSLSADNILDGTIVAQGVRNSVGMDWSPINELLWFTDNGRDDLLTVTNMPDDELNVITKTGGEFFGYPYCHSLGCGNPYQRDINCVSAITDPDLGDGGFTDNCTVNVTLSKQAVGPHIAALGMRFYNPNNGNNGNYKQMFPAKYKNAMFIAQHGSWDRTPLIGYRIGVVFVDSGSDNNDISEYDLFAQGWLNDTTQSVWGRVSDLDFLIDGSMIVSDDQASLIYRIYYDSSLDTIDAQIEYAILKKELAEQYDIAYQNAMNLETSNDIVL